MDALCPCAQSARPVINRVHRRDNGEENLRRADVTRRFVAPDVLFTRLQREAIRGAAFGIVRNTDEPAGHVTLELIARRKKGGVRSPKSERDTKTLRVADCDIRAKFSRRL